MFGQFPARMHMGVYIASYIGMSAKHLHLADASASSRNNRLAIVEPFCVFFCMPVILTYT